MKKNNYKKLYFIPILLLFSGCGDGFKNFRDGLSYYYKKTLEGYKLGLSIEEIRESIDIPLGETSGFGEPVLVKTNFIKSNN